MTYIKFLLLFFIFFPYVNPIVTPWSLQPFALLFSLIYLSMLKHNYINVKIVSLLIIGFVSIIISVLSLSDPINSLRSVANYISLPIIVWAIYVLNPSSDYVLRFVKISAYIYFCIGFIQLFISPGFLSFLVPHQGDPDILISSGRGVCSLAPEPSYFGFILYLYFFIGVLIKDKYLTVISCLGLIFLAQSFTVIFCLIISLFFLFSFKNFKNFSISLILLLITIVTSFVVISSINIDARSIILLQSLIFDGVGSTLDNDASASGRLYHIFYPITQSFYSFFIPKGYNGLPNGDTRILSGLAGPIYEIGFFAFFMFNTIFSIIFDRNKFSLNVMLSIGIGLLMFIINANQIGMPVFCFLISFLLYKKKNFMIT